MIVIEAKVSWSTVYYSSDFLAIWIWHLQNSKMSKSTLFLVQNCEGCLVSCITWFQTLGASLKHFWSFSRVLATEAEVSWSTVYYTSDFSAIWKWHLQNTKMSKSTSILVQTCAERLETCTTMWYMIPCARQEFHALWKVSRGFECPRVHQNSHINSVLSSYSCLAHGIMYHHVIHDSKRLAQVWWLMEGFPGVLSHPGRHTGPRKNTFFGFKNRENTYSSEKQF